MFSAQMESLDSDDLTSFSHVFTRFDNAPAASSTTSLMPTASPSEREEERRRSRSHSVNSNASSPPVLSLRVRQKHVGRDDIVSAVNIHKTYLLGVEGVPALRGMFSPFTIEHTSLHMLRILYTYVCFAYRTFCVRLCMLLDACN